MNVGIYFGRHWGGLASPNFANISVVRLVTAKPALMIFSQKILILGL